MAQTPGVAVDDGFPGNPGIWEVSPEAETQKLNDGVRLGVNPSSGVRRVTSRAEIDTSPPFGSVKEAVTRFGGSGPWIPLYKLGEAFNNIEDFDIKKMEEQAAQLEKDLIMKELETLDVLEELAATKRIVEDMKQQLQIGALECFSTPEVNHYEQVEAPVIKKINDENCRNNKERILKSPCHHSVSSPDPMLMNIKQAEVNAVKTINDLALIQSSVESLNKKMKREKIFLQRTREKLASKIAAVSAHEKAQQQTRLNSPAAPAVTSGTFDNDFKSDAGLYNRVVETRRSEVSKPLNVNEENGFSIKTAEMKWFAAKKMEEAARAAEAIALAEIHALSITDRLSGFALPEPERVTFALGERSPLSPKAQIPEESIVKKVIHSKFQIDEINNSKLTILKKLEEAKEEVLHSKQVLTDALNRVETANRKQHAAEEGLRRWIPVDDGKSKAGNKFNQGGHCQDSVLPDVTWSATVNNDQKPVLRQTVSRRDVLSRKQVPEEYATRMEIEGNAERHKVALRQGQTLPPKSEKERRTNQKQFTGQRKKFGFIQISLPMGKTSKKRA